MKTLIAGLFAVLVGLGFAASDAEAAKRLGGGKSMGMQREAAKPATPPTAGAPAPAAAAAPAGGLAQGAAAATPKRSWLGPVAGLAAGLGLAALASHLGFGEELANFLLIGLLALVAIVVVRMLLRRKAAGQEGAGMQYAGATPGARGPIPMPVNPAASPLAGSAPAAAPRRIPAGFDVDGFARQAKLNFIRLQAANDAGNLDDIREFTSPEMFAEIKVELAERGGAEQLTDVQQLEAEVLEVAEEASRYVVSVRFRGLIREEGEAAAAPFDEIWHLTKPVDGSRGWVVSGIQQTR